MRDDGNARFGVNCGLDFHPHKRLMTDAHCSVLRRRARTAPETCIVLAATLPAKEVA